MKCIIATCLLFLTSCLTGNAAEMPVAAEIVDVPAERRDYGIPIGNVRVRFADGHSEMWTRLGRCMQVQRSAAGRVGWTRYTNRNLHGEPVNNVLRVMTANGSWQDFQAGPFIREWDFAIDGASVVVLSGGRHGAGMLHRFSLKAGELTGVVKESTRKEELPDWAMEFVKEKEVVA